MDENIEATQANASEPQESAPSTSAKPKKKRLTTTIIVVVVVIVVAGIGMFAWHETPSFCGTLCHDGMNSYLATYEQEAGVEGVDKYGNTVSNTNAMLVVSHKDDDIACLDCHKAAINQQISELSETITGDYTVVERTDGTGNAFQEVSLDQLMENSEQGSGMGDEFCLKSGCHTNDDGSVMTREDLTELTSDMEWNPHQWQHSDTTCSDCHKSHRASVFACTQCHSGAESSVPDGWLTYEESVAQLPAGA